MPIVEFSIGPRPQAVSVIRQRVRAELVMDGVPLNDEEADNLELMASEIATNALVHGCAVGRRDQYLHVTADLVDAMVRVAVTDPGMGPVQGPVRARQANADDEGGRGLFLVKCLATRHGIVRDRVTGARTSWFEMAVRSLTPAPTDVMKVAAVSPAERAAGEGIALRLAVLGAHVGRRAARPAPWLGSIGPAEPRVA